MGLPTQARRPGAAHGAPPPAVPKTAVLEVTRSDNGDATYRLLIDGVEQKLGSSTAKWDDASPWESGSYDSSFSKLRGKYDAFLIEYPPNRSQIKFHLGTATGHSEGCIVTKNANIVEIEDVLAKNKIPKDDLKFDVKGDFPIGFKLSVKDGVAEVVAGGMVTLVIELTGGGAPGGVSKDLWFHIVADSLSPKDYQLLHPDTVPPYISRSSYPDTKPGMLVRLPQGQRSHEYQVKIIDHAPPAAHAHAATRPAPNAGLTARKTVIFSIDNYKILNKAPGPAPYFYTPSSYRLVLAQGSKASPVSIQPAAGGTPSLRPAGLPH